MSLARYQVWRVAFEAHIIAESAEDAARKVTTLSAGPGVVSVGHQHLHAEWVRAIDPNTVCGTISWLYSRHGGEISEAIEGLQEIEEELR